MQQERAKRNSNSIAITPALQLQTAVACEMNTQFPEYPSYLFQKMKNQKTQTLFCLQVSSECIFGCKEYNQSDFCIDHLVMSMCRDISSLLEECLLWHVCSFDETLLCFALLHFALQCQTCLLLQVSLDFPLFISIPYDEKGIQSCLYSNSLY